MAYMAFMVDNVLCLAEHRSPMVSATGQYLAKMVFYINSYLQACESSNSPLENTLSPGKNQNHNPADNNRTQILHDQQLNSMNTAAHTSLGVDSDSQYHDYSWRHPTIYGDSMQSVQSQGITTPAWLFMNTTKPGTTKSFLVFYIIGILKFYAPTV
jgi:hypothetical protein